MRKQFLVTIALALVIVAFQNCSNHSFLNASDGSSLGKLDGSEDEFGDGRGRIPAEDMDDGDEDDEGRGQIPLEEFLDVLSNLPAEAPALIKEYRCYISGGQGHGIELCMPGSKEAIKNLRPIEIKDDEICTPHQVVQTNAALFSGAVIGRCD